MPISESRPEEVVRLRTAFRGQTGRFGGYSKGVSYVDGVAQNPCDQRTANRLLANFGASEFQILGDWDETAPETLATEPAPSLVSGAEDADDVSDEGGDDSDEEPPAHADTIPGPAPKPSRSRRKKAAE